MKSKGRVSASCSAPALPSVSEFRLSAAAGAGSSTSGDSGECDGGAASFDEHPAAASQAQPLVRAAACDRHLWGRRQHF